MDVHETHAERIPDALQSLLEGCQSGRQSKHQDADVQRAVHRVELQDVEKEDEMHAAFNVRALCPLASNPPHPILDIQGRCNAWQARDRICDRSG